MSGALLWIALGLAALVGGAGVLYVVRAARLRARPILLVALLLGALPSLYVALCWAGVLIDSYLRFDRPWGVVVLLGAIGFVTYRLGRHRTRASRARVALGDLYAVIATSAAALVLAGPQIGKPLDRMSVLIAVDRSRSMELVPSASERIARELSAAEQSMREGDQIGTIAFAADAKLEDPPRPKSSLPAPQKVAIGRDGTDLAAAIRRSLAEATPDRAARIVALSDGVANRGDTLAAAAAAVAADVPIDVVVLEQRKVPDVRVVALRAPARADKDEPIDLRLVTSAPAPTKIEIRVRRDGELISHAQADISAGEDILRIRERATEPGFHRYDVEVTALDPSLDQAPEDNSASAFVRVRGPSSALVLEGDEGQGAFIATSLQSAAYRVTTGSTASFPADLAGLAAYDLIVLSDVRASDLGTSQIEALASYVRDLGGGLVLMGGDRSMGPGGYAKTPIEEISPVSFDLKQDKRRASLAEVIGIDISGSMAAEVAGHTKLELANEAAARSASLLGAGDMLGVMHVDTAVNWSVPLGPVTDNAAIDKAIRAVGPGGGGIYVDITLRAAYAALDRQKVNLKHVLLFADGSDAENMTGCRVMVSDAYGRGITTSVVALGKGSDVPELEQLSRLGNGRFYLVEDATRLPAIFSQETIAASRSAIVEEPFRVSLGQGGSLVAGIDFDAAPALGGYVITLPKGRASVYLRGPEGDPILATWSAGMGRSAAFTSDLKSRWGAEWTRWPGAARMIAQVARDVSRRAEDERVRLESDASGGELHVRATIVGDDGRAQSFRRLIAHVASPDGSGREIPLEAVGAGAYAATLPLSRPGAYIVAARDELDGAIVGTTGAVLTAGEELRPTGSDAALLARIAAMTGGKRRDTLAGIFNDRAAKRFAYESLSQTLIVLAAIALLLLVAARRLSLPDRLVALTEQARASLRREPRAAARRVPRVATTDILLAKQKQAREQHKPDGPARRSRPVGAAPAPADPIEEAPAGSSPALPVTPVAARPRRPAPARPPAPPATKSVAELLLERRRAKSDPTKPPGA